MQCQSPVTINNPAFYTKSNVRNRYMTVPCAKCAACISNKRSEWSTRLEIEMKHQKKAVFVTLTYMDNVVPLIDGQPSLRKVDVQLFLKRLRHTQKEKIKYYFVGEYGTNTMRPHYHAIIFNLMGSMDEITFTLLKSWNNGLIHVGDCNEKSIRYTTKYMIQKSSYDKKDAREAPFSLVSRGLGKNYIANSLEWHQQDDSRNYIIKAGGTKARLPRYFRDKLYSKRQREKQNAETLKNSDQCWNEKTDAQKSQDLKLEHDRKEQFKNRINKSIKTNEKL